MLLIIFQVLLFLVVTDVHWYLQLWICNVWITRRCREGDETNGTSHVDCFVRLCLCLL